MVYERYPRDELSGDEFRRPQAGDRNRQYRSGARDDDTGYGGQGYGTARDDYRERSDAGEDRFQRGYYSAASADDVPNRGTRYGSGRHGHDYGAYNVGGSNYAGRDFGRSNPNSGGYRSRQDYGGQREPADYNYNERGFFNRAGDEVRSWFGDDEAERRRELDQRYDQRYARGDERDQDYHSWRSGQIAALDRDYDEYRRENQQRFHNEFGSWRTDRQGQRNSLSKVTEHMDVVGSDGEHVGTVDKVRGDRVILTKSDADAGGRHHSVPSRWIESVDDRVTLRKTADEAKSHWRDEERGAFFNEDGRMGGRDNDASGRILNRSFSGTY